MLRGPIELSPIERKIRQGLANILRIYICFVNNEEEVKCKSGSCFKYSDNRIYICIDINFPVVDSAYAFKKRIKYLK